MEAVALVRLALNVITERLLIILSLALSFTLACWAMWNPRWETLTVMAFFSMFSYLAINSKVRNNIDMNRTD
jgi:hypothetical protein